VTLFAAALAAGIAGFVALSCEILWFRVYSYITGGSPVTFGLLLGLYLAGLAVGSDIAGKICRRLGGGDSQGQSILVRFAFLANVCAFLVIPVMAKSTSAPGRGWFALAAVFVSATLFGALLPMISHLGISPTERAGEKLSYVYFSNILGSVCGSLLTGFVLTDVLTTQRIAMLTALVGLVLVGIVALDREKRLLTPTTSFIMLVSAAGFVLATPVLFERLYEKLQFKDVYRGQRFAQIVENRHGVIAVSDSGATFGGGVYDGHVSTDLINNHNAIERAYVVTALHPHPRKVLVIGMATGAWSQVIVNSPTVDSMTIVEINPGYLNLVRKYPAVSSLLNNRKAEIVIDDGRRWLVRNPGRKFDLIVSNTTFHYRANTTNLLSAEFMRLVHARLEPGGMFYFNTTGSQDAMKTAFSEFPHGMRVINFIAASDSMLTLDSLRWHDMLASYRIDGRPVLDVTRAADRSHFDRLMRLPSTINRSPVSRGLESRESVLARIPRARVITDDNMLPEWHSLILHSELSPPPD
jgi:spermidine synthase